MLNTQEGTYRITDESESLFPQSASVYNYAVVDANASMAWITPISTIKTNKPTGMGVMARESRWVDLGDIRRVDVDGEAEQKYWYLAQDPSRQEQWEEVRDRVRELAS